jgi:sugar/nucleoside kinase (ribokinase family)
VAPAAGGRLLLAGHVTRDASPSGDQLGGSVAYAAQTAVFLGWTPGIVTAAGPDFDPARELPGVEMFVTLSAATTRFENAYDDQGARRQRVTARADQIDAGIVPAHWRSPEVLLLAPVAAELPPRSGAAFGARLVGACGQGWLRAISQAGDVSTSGWHDPDDDLAGVHVLFLSLEDVGGVASRAHERLDQVDVVALTRGREGATVVTRDRTLTIPTPRRVEIDPTGAGDVFAAAFLLRYHETKDLERAGRFACSAASFAVEGSGWRTLGRRTEVEQRARDALRGKNT